ncbi:unnamed protein product [Gadus morhua 'NCC']
MDATRKAVVARLSYCHVTLPLLPPRPAPGTPSTIHYNPAHTTITPLPDQWGHHHCSTNSPTSEHPLYPHLYQTSASPIPPPHPQKPTTTYASIKQLFQHHHRNHLHPTLRKPGLPPPVPHTTSSPNTNPLTLPPPLSHTALRIRSLSPYLPPSTPLTAHLRNTTEPYPAYTPPPPPLHNRLYLLHRQQLRYAGCYVASGFLWNRPRSALSGYRADRRLGDLRSTMVTGANEFERLAAVAKLVLVLPHSNADAERVFSIVGLNKTKTRNSLALDGPLSSIMTIKMADLEPCFKWDPPSDVLKLGRVGNPLRKKIFLTEQLVSKHPNTDVIHDIPSTQRSRDLFPSPHLPTVDHCSVDTQCYNIWPHICNATQTRTGLILL